MGDREGQITELLHGWKRGDELALHALTQAVYEELRRRASSRLRAEGANHTLQPTELVHEAFVRLVDAPIQWQDRVHFFAVVASTMRRVLVDHARAKGRKKRGGRAVKVTLADSAFEDAEPAVDVLDLDQALRELASLDATQARLVELHYFTGLTLDEISEATGIARSSAHRLLRSARAWIRHRLTGRPGEVTDASRS